MGRRVVGLVVRRDGGVRMAEGWMERRWDWQRRRAGRHDCTREIVATLLIREKAL